MEKSSDLSEARRFDLVLTKALSVSHDELVRRDKKWKKQQERKRKKSATARKKTGS